MSDNDAVLNLELSRPANASEVLETMTAEYGSTGQKRDAPSTAGSGWLETTCFNINPDRFSEFARSDLLAGSSGLRYVTDYPGNYRVEGQAVNQVIQVCLSLQTLLHVVSCCALTCKTSATTAA